MKIIFFLYATFCMPFLNHAMHFLQAITHDDLALIASVKERRSPNFLELIGTLSDGTQIKYRETLSGENVGLATVVASAKNIKDETSADFWGKLLMLKLEQK